MRLRDSIYISHIDWVIDMDSSRYVRYRLTYYFPIIVIGHTSISTIHSCVLGYISKHDHSGGIVILYHSFPYYTYVSESFAFCVIHTAKECESIYVVAGVYVDGRDVRLCCIAYLYVVLGEKVQRMHE